MLDPRKKRYLYMTLSIFGAISLSVLFFFLIYRMQGVGTALDTLADILMPFIYGGVVAYLLRPMCNAFEGFFETLLGKKRPGLVRFFAVGLSRAHRDVEGAFAASGDEEIDVFNAIQADQGRGDRLTHP